MNRWACCLVPVAMIFLCGCGQKGPSAHGKAEMDFNGIKLIAEGANPGVWSAGNESVTITVAGKKIVVEKEQLLVDGVSKAKIPSGTKSIRAVSRDESVVVELDGKEAFKLGP